MLIESVRQLARGKIAPRAAHYDACGEFPRDNVKAINELGLNAMFIPEPYGGAPQSYAAYDIGAPPWSSGMNMAFSPSALIAFTLSRGNSPHAS